MTPNEPHPQRVMLACNPEWLEASAPDGKPALPRFSMVAYTGGAMRVAGWRFPVVVDFGGMDLSSQNLPIRRGHNADRLVGHAESVRLENGNLIASGVLSFETDEARQVASSARNGFRWQASIGASVEDVEFVKEGQSVAINGREFKGPVNVIRRSKLDEISFVDLGADRQTSASVAASAQKKEDIAVENDKTNENPQAAPAAATQGAVEEIRAKALEEARRIAAVQRVSHKHPEIAEKAISGGWDEARTELEVLRAERPSAPAVGSGARENLSAEVLEAAVCMSAGLEGVEKKFEARALETADKRFKRQLGLQDLLMEAAWANGYSGRSFRSDIRGVLEAAFSTFSLPGILSNVANKFLLDGFEAVESSWREVAATRNVRDFKQVTSYRLTGGFEYEEIGPDGELKHAKVGEESYTNQARTYGKMFSITRQDLINDDLGALTVVPRRLGRGAALKLNDVFWRAFLNNAAFFAVANKNYLAGVDTLLSIDGLTKAEQLFLDQTDSDGHPLAVAPATLLVPNGLLVTATQLMQSTELRDNDAGAKKYPVTNPHAGKFGVVRSSYLSNVKYPGASTKAWYLLASPADMPVIEVAFLNGREQPTVESADADFNVLGVQMRGYHDFGVALQEPRGGVKMKGEA